MKPLKIIVPVGTMLNSVYPAAVIAGNTEVSQATCNALYGALGVIACSQATMNNFIWGSEVFQNYETVGGGTGAGPGFNGCDAVQSHMPNTLMTDPEILESFGIRDGSGGAGKWSGGNGAGDAASGTGEGNDCSHRVVPPFGVDGGAAGHNAAVLPDGTRVALKGDDEIDLPAGGVFEMLTPGGAAGADKGVSLSDCSENGRTCLPIKPTS